MKVITDTTMARGTEIPETLPCPSCGARDHGLEIKVGLLKADTMRLEVMIQSGWRIIISDRGVWMVLDRNDNLIGEGKTPRESIDVALSQRPPAEDGYPEFGFRHDPL